MELLVGLLLIAVAFAIYFLPTIIAFNRGHNNSGAIFALNLLLGWSLLGWVVALVWAFTSDVKKEESTKVPQTMRRSEPALTGIPKSSTKACPFCAETIQAAAIVCKHCGRDLPQLGARVGPA